LTGSYWRDIFLMFNRLSLLYAHDPAVSAKIAKALYKETESAGASVWFQFEKKQASTVFFSL